MANKGKQVEPAHKRPKRDWVTPRLTGHGSLKEITAGPAKLAGTPDGNGGSFIGV